MTHILVKKLAAGQERNRAGTLRSSREVVEDTSSVAFKSNRSFIWASPGYHSEVCISSKNTRRTSERWFTQKDSLGRIFRGMTWRAMLNRAVPLFRALKLANKLRIMLTKVVSEVTFNVVASNKLGFLTRETCSMVCLGSILNTFLYARLTATISSILHRSAMLVVLIVKV